LCVDGSGNHRNGVFGRYTPQLYFLS